MIKYKIGTEFLDNYAGKSVNSAFAISKSISKIGEIGSRHGDRSTSFKVPLTAKNIRLLNYSTELNNANLEGTKKLNGQIVEDDQIIAIGYFQVVRFSPYKREVDLRFYSGNSDWFSLLKERKLNQNYENYDVNEVLNILINSTDFQSNLTSDLPTSITDKGDTYYKYFLTDNGKKPTRNYTPDGGDTVLNTYFEDYQIGFSQGYLFEKIFNSFNIKLKGNLFSNPEFYRTLICNPIDLSGAKSQNEEGFYKLNDRDSYTVPYQVSNPNQYGNIFFDLPVTDSNTYNRSGFTIGDNEFVSSGFYIDISLQCLAPRTGDDLSSQDVFVRVRKFDSVGTETLLGVFTAEEFDKQKQDVGGDQGATQVTSFVFALEFENETLNAGDSIVVDYNTNIPTTSTGVGVFKNYNANLAEPYFGYNLFDYYTTSERSVLLPDMTQSEFVKDALLQFGAVSQYDSATKTLTCNTFDVIEANKSKAKDYSNKLDLSIDPQVDITKQVQNYGKRSLFRYAENEKEDFLSNLYKKITGYKLGDGVINIENDFLDEDKDVYTSPFAPTINTATFPRQNVLGGNNQLGNLYLPFIPVFEFEDIDGGASTLSDLAKYKITELKPRKLLFVDNVDFVDGSNKAMKGNVDTITLNDPNSALNPQVNYTSFPLVYFDKDDYPEFETSTLNQYNKSLSFGRLNQLTDKTYGYGATVKTKDTIIDKYYNLQTRVLNKPITLEAYFRLTSIDIANYDGFTPIWLSFGLDSGYYYINEIEQYQGQNKSTKLTLIKI